MKAIVHERYGPPELLELRDVEQPKIGDEQVLVRVHASSVNPVDWYGVAGLWLGRLPNALRKPKDPRVGLDVAGRVEAVGSAVTTMQPGDEVFGSALGAWAEYAVADAAKLALKPATVSFDEAGCVSIAGRTALQAIRDHGRVQPGQKVLVNGASGGVGVRRPDEGVRRRRDRRLQHAERRPRPLLGADRVVDYTQDDFTRHAERHDVLLDVTGSRRFGAPARPAPAAKVVLIGAPMKDTSSGRCRTSSARAWPASVAARQSGSCSRSQARTTSRSSAACSSRARCDR